MAKTYLTEYTNCHMEDWNGISQLHSIIDSYGKDGYRVVGMFNTVSMIHVFMQKEVDSDELKKEG